MKYVFVALTVLLLGIPLASPPARACTTQDECDQQQRVEAQQREDEARYRAQEEREQDEDEAADRARAEQQERSR